MSRETERRGQQMAEGAPKIEPVSAPPTPPPVASGKQWTAEAFRPFDPGVSASGDEITIHGDDRELCVLDVANAEVLRDMLDETVADRGGKGLRRAVAEEIAAAIEAYPGARGPAIDDPRDPRRSGLDTARRIARDLGKATT